MRETPRNAKEFSEKAICLVALLRGISSASRVVIEVQNQNPERVVVLDGARPVPCPDLGAFNGTFRPIEEAVLAMCSDVGWGEIEVSVQTGLVQSIKVVSQSFKLGSA